MGDLSEADPTAEVLYHLTHDQAVAALWVGGGHVSGVMEAPWPHLVVSPGESGDIGLARGAISHDVRIELYGPPDHSVGPAALWRQMLAVLASIVSMSERDHIAGRAVVARSRVAGGIGRQPLANGQLRLSASVQLTVTAPH